MPRSCSCSVFYSSTKFPKTRQVPPQCLFCVQQGLITAVRIGSHHLGAFCPLESSHHVAHQSRGCEQGSILQKAQERSTGPLEKP